MRAEQAMSPRRLRTDFENQIFRLTWAREIIKCGIEKRFISFGLQTSESLNVVRATTPILTN